MTRWLAPADALLEVERVYALAHADLLDGSARPGTELTIADLGERYRAAGEVADAVLARLLSEGQLQRRGVSAVVPALDRAELGQLLRLRRQLEPDMFARACRHVRGGELAALVRATNALAADPAPAPIAETVERAQLILSGADVSTDWPARAVRMAWRPMRRYVHITARALLHTEELPKARHASVRLLSEYRTRSPRRVRAAQLRELHDVERVLDLGLGDLLSSPLNSA